MMNATRRAGRRFRAIANCSLLVIFGSGCSGPPYCDGDKFMRYSPGHAGPGSWSVAEDCEGYECREAGHDERTGHCILRDEPNCANGVASFCRDNTIFTCERNQVAVRGGECGERFCHEHESQAFCSVFSEENPECESEGRYSVCEGDTIITCLGGLKVEEERCGPSEFSEHPMLCRERDSQAFCSLSEESVAACPNAGEGYACFDSLRVQCLDGWPVREMRCEGECIDRPEGVLCVHDGPDSRCPENGRPGVCDGNRALSCADGYLLSEHTCTEGHVCVVEDCALETNSDRGRCQLNHLESTATCYNL